MNGGVVSCAIIALGAFLVSAAIRSSGNADTAYVVFFGCGCLGATLAGFLFRA